MQKKYIIIPFDFKPLFALRRKLGPSVGPIKKPIPCDIQTIHDLLMQKHGNELRIFEVELTNGELRQDYRNPVELTLDNYKLPYSEIIAMNSKEEGTDMEQITPPTTVTPSPVVPIPLAPEPESEPEPAPPEPEERPEPEPDTDTDSHPENHPEGPEKEDEDIKKEPEELPHQDEDHKEDVPETGAEDIGAEALDFDAEPTPVQAEPKPHSKSIKKRK